MIPACARGLELRFPGGVACVDGREHQRDASERQSPTPQREEDGRDEDDAREEDRGDALDPEALAQMDISEGETAVEIPHRIVHFFGRE